MRYLLIQAGLLWAMFGAHYLSRHGDTTMVAVVCFINAVVLFVVAWRPSLLGIK